MRRPRAPRGGHPRAPGREDAGVRGAGRGGGSCLSKMRDGSRAAGRALLPHHGLHLPAPAQPAPGHPARPGECGGRRDPSPGQSEETRSPPVLAPIADVTAANWTGGLFLFSSFFAFMFFSCKCGGAGEKKIPCTTSSNELLKKFWVALFPVPKFLSLLID